MGFGSDSICWSYQSNLRTKGITIVGNYEVLEFWRIQELRLEAVRGDNCYISKPINLQTC